MLDDMTDDIDYSRQYKVNAGRCDRCGNYKTWEFKFTNPRTGKGMPGHVTEEGYKIGDGGCPYYSSRAQGTGGGGSGGWQKPAPRPQKPNPSLDWMKRIREEGGQGNQGANQGTNQASPTQPPAPAPAPSLDLGPLTRLLDSHHQEDSQNLMMALGAMDQSIVGAGNKIASALDKLSSRVEVISTELTASSPDVMVKSVFEMAVESLQVGADMMRQDILREIADMLDENNTFSLSEVAAFLAEKKGLKIGE